MREGGRGLEIRNSTDFLGGRNWALLLPAFFSIEGDLKCDGTDKGGRKRYSSTKQTFPLYGEQINKVS